MLPISNEARAKLFSRSLNDRIEILITPNVQGASPIMFEDKDIVPSSVVITKMCADDTQIKIGTSMCQQLDVQLRYNFGESNYLGAKIETKYYIILSPDNEELLAHHTFYITEIEQTAPQITSIKAYCVVQKFNKAIGSRVFNGTPFQILRDVNVCLGESILDVPDDGSVPSEFADLPNVNSTVQLTEAENDCRTCRDVANAVCQMMGVFIQAEPSTLKAQLCTYHSAVDLVIDLTNRKEFSHNRYQKAYTALEVTGAKGTFTSPRTLSDSEQIYIVEDAPCWDFGTDSGLQARTDALKALVITWDYTPGEIVMWSDPTIECGDRLKVITNDGNYELLVTEVTWNYMGNTVIKSAGEDRSASMSAGGSRRSSMAENANKLIMYDVTNTSAVELDEDDDPYQLCRVAFSSIANTEVMWFGEALIQAIAENVDVPVTVVPVDSQGDPVTVLDRNGNAVVWTANTSHKDDVHIKVTYMLDSTELSYHPKDEYLSGDHILSMFYTAPIDEQSAHTWEVWIEVTKGAITIDEHKFNGTLMGQNLVATESWGGILTLFEDINAFITSAIASTISESNVVVNIQYPVKFVKTDNITSATTPIVTETITDALVFALRYGDHINFCGEGYYSGTDGVLL